jgi:hypothetical protein
MIKGFFLMLAVAMAMGAARPQTTAAEPYEGTGNGGLESPIDRLVAGKLRSLRVQAANSCSDAVFVRRVYLDVIGTVPTPQEAKAFLQDTDAAKRRKLIDRLLEREEFADYWAMKWCDVLRVKAEFPINLWPNAAQAYHRWIRTSIRENKPYDKFVREILTASGSNFRVGQVNFYRAVPSREAPVLAQAAALSFMGARAENWPAERLVGMAGFFSQVGYKSTAEWKEEIVFWDPGKATAGTVATSTTAVSTTTASTTGPSAVPTVVFPDGTRPQRNPAVDPREMFADWLVRPGNPWFARSITNRVWTWLMGRGIVNEPDDIRFDNPASNEALLNYLERELLAGHYDLKRIYRLILNSKTYQRSSIPMAADSAARAIGEENFATYPLRRLEAEVLIDALCQITGTREQYSSAIPEPFTFIPLDQRSIALPDGSITSSFMEMFGRPARDTGLESERNNRPTADQSLHLLNSGHIQKKLEQSPRLQAILQSKRGPREMVGEIYLLILSRYPTDDELRIAGEYARSANFKGREAMVDLAWALINSAEFLYRH